MTIFPFGIDFQALNISRGSNLAIWKVVGISAIGRLIADQVIYTVEIWIYENNAWNLEVATQFLLQASLDILWNNPIPMNIENDVIMESIIKHNTPQRAMKVGPFHDIRAVKNIFNKLSLVRLLIYQGSAKDKQYALTICPYELHFLQTFQYQIATKIQYKSNIKNI